jgi:hypothetical protein
MMTSPEERETEEARQALLATRASASVTAGIIEEARSALDVVRAHREANHYTEKFRSIIRGA